MNQLPIVSEKAVKSLRILSLKLKDSCHWNNY